MQVAVLDFLFLAKLRFPQTKSVTQIITSRYREKSIRSVRKFENCFRKAVQNLSFLMICSLGNVIPNLLSFRLAKTSLQGSVTYNQCQLNLLKEEIPYKKSHI